MNKRLTILLGVLLISIGVLIIINAEYLAVRVGNNPDGLDKYNVVIESVYDSPRGEQYGVGSGVVISQNGIVLTAKHVVNGATSVRITLHDGRVFTMTEFYTDPNSDIAYIDLPCDVNDFILLAAPNGVKNGDKAALIGNPFGYLQDQVAYGRVVNAALNRLLMDPVNPVLMIKTRIMSGYSGGGVYVRHRLVGIISRSSPDYVFVIGVVTCRQALERSGYTQ